MAKKELQALVIEQKILNRIYVIRAEKIMLDKDLAELFGIETRVLKQAVKRNIERFPKDFMFEMTSKEIDGMVSQNVIPSKSYFGGATPFCFTEQGVMMLPHWRSYLTNTKAEMHQRFLCGGVSVRQIIKELKPTMYKSKIGFFMYEVIMVKKL